MKHKEHPFSLGVLLSLLFILTACDQSSVSPPSPGSTIGPIASVTAPPVLSPTPLGGVSAKLGSLPQHCPAGPTPQEIPQITSAIGTSPVWAGAFQKIPLILGWTPGDANLYHGQYGWGHKFLWVVDANYHEFVTLRGFNVQDGAPLLPEAEESAPTSTLTSLVLNPQDPQNPPQRHIGHWIEFPGGIIIPKAGCYELIATWAGGSWHAVFAAGEVSSY